MTAFYLRELVGITVCMQLHVQLSRLGCASIAKRTVGPLSQVDMIFTFNLILLSYYILEVQAGTIKLIILKKCFIKIKLVSFHK